jgi:hypothetical protein
MKSNLILLSLAVGGISLLGACRKADQKQTQEQSVPTQGVLADAKNAVLLKGKWPVGNHYIYRMQLDQLSTNKIPQVPKPIQQDTMMSMEYGLSVLHPTADGGRELEVEFLAIQMQVKTGEQPILGFDSKVRAESEAEDPLASSLRKMIGSKVRLLVNADGKVTSVVGLDEWRNNIGLEDAGPAGQMLNQQFNVAFFHQLADFGRGLAGKPVTVGETWPFKVDFPSGATGKIAVDAKITLKGWEKCQNHHCALLESRGTFSGTPGDEIGPMGKMTIDGGKVAGKTWFDPELGALIESVSDQSIHIKGEIPQRGGGDRRAGGFTSDIGQKITVKLVELGKTKG